jgi:hypothetical protein
MMETFGLAVVPEIRVRVHEIRGLVTSWASFAERLRDEYFDEDSDRVTKRSFLDWVEQQPGKLMGPNELLREFEKKYNQLPLAERRLLDPRKAELFCKQLMMLWRIDFFYFLEIGILKEALPMTEGGWKRL